MIDGHDARLAAELDKLGYNPLIVRQAKMGQWSDFKTPLVAPKLELVAMLEANDHIELAKRVVAGEFDG